MSRESRPTPVGFLPMWLGTTVLANEMAFTAIEAMVRFNTSAFLRWWR